MDALLNEKLIIKGQSHASGEVSISGAKNSVLKLMAASLLCSDVCAIYNVPDLSDVEIKNYVVVDNELISISPRIISLSKNLKELSDINNKKEKK